MSRELGREDLHESGHFPTLDFQVGLSEKEYPKARKFVDKYYRAPQQLNEKSGSPLFPYESSADGVPQVITSANINRVLDKGTCEETLHTSGRGVGRLNHDTSGRDVSRSTIMLRQHEQSLLNSSAVDGSQIGLEETQRRLHDKIEVQGDEANESMTLTNKFRMMHISEAHLQGRWSDSRQSIPPGTKEESYMQPMVHYSHPSQVSGMNSQMMLSGCDSKVRYLNEPFNISSKTSLEELPRRLMPSRNPPAQQKMTEPLLHLGYQSVAQSHGSAPGSAHASAGASKITSSVSYFSESTSNYQGSQQADSSKDGSANGPKKKKIG